MSHILIYSIVFLLSASLSAMDEAFKPVETKTPEVDAVQRDLLRFSEDGQRMVSISLGYGDYRACVWDVCQKSLLFELVGHSGFVDSARFSEDGSKIVTSARDSTIKVWNAVDGSLIASSNVGYWATHALFISERLILAIASPRLFWWDYMSNTIITCRLDYDRIEPLWLLALKFNMKSSRVNFSKLYNANSSVRDAINRYCRDDN